ncbi:hypothetical protein [Flavobacterium sp. 1355]|uniref:hypothetical protein n=1 Tax=Flavobacterium sp. 1355 TaxID=2806571 RepID=UPI001AE5375C|nr:hypothetical protein [Flavobacterium sp. 1355]MBP1222644.1 hypothetical protein [Flavobacterium sp. 1355]
MDVEDFKSRSKNIAQIVAIISGLVTSLPYLLIQEEKVIDYVYDIMLICVFTGIVLASWYFTSRKLKNQLLFKLIAVFVFFHCVAFPLVYTYLLNSDPSNLRIEKDILESEKSNQFVLVKEIYGETSIHKQNILQDIISHEPLFARTNTDSIKNNQMYILKNYIIVADYQLSFGGNHPPEPIRSLTIYDKKGNYKLFVENEKEFRNISSVFADAINKYKSVETKKNNEIDKIKVNKFWSYKSVLPYSLNIFTNGNLVPKSKIANTIYFIHNLFIFIFILSIIVGILQNIYTDQNK